MKNNYSLNGLRKLKMKWKWRKDIKIKMEFVDGKLMKKQIKIVY